MGSDSKEVTLTDLPGVGEKTAQKLIDSGFKDLMAIAVCPEGDLMEICEITESAAKKIIHAARQMLQMNFISAEELLERRKSVGQIKTGSGNIDKLLGGGVETQAITEFHGEFGSGKTQVAFQLAVNVQKPVDEGGLNGEVIYIDTEGTFRPERIVQLAEAQKMNSSPVLKKVHIARAFSSDHQVLLAEKIPELIDEKEIPVKLVVIDSLMGLFRAEYIGRGTLADRQQKLNRHLHTLQRLADRYNLAIFVTNQVMARPDVFFGNPNQAVGGHILAHASTFRVFLRKSKGNKRIARLIDSPNLPEAEAVFSLNTEGIKD